MDSIKSQGSSILIERIFCGNKYSAFITNSGEMWACGNCANAGKVAIAKQQMGGAAAMETDPEDERKHEQMHQDKEFAKVIAAQNAQADGSDSSSEEWGGGRNKKRKGNNKNKGGGKAADKKGGGKQYHGHTVTKSKKA